MIDLSNIAKPGKSERISLILMVKCPNCSATLLHGGKALLDKGCPQCQRGYSKLTIQTMRNCYEFNESLTK